MWSVYTPIFICLNLCVPVFVRPIVCVLQVSVSIDYKCLDLCLVVYIAQCLFPRVFMSYVCMVYLSQHCVFPRVLRFLWMQMCVYMCVFQFYFLVTV